MSRPFPNEFPTHWTQPKIYNQFCEMPQPQPYPPFYPNQMMAFQPIQMPYAIPNYYKMMPTNMNANGWPQQMFQMSMSSKPLGQKIPAFQINQNSQTRLTNQQMSNQANTEVICLDDSDQEVIEVKPPQPPKQTKKSKTPPLHHPKPTVSQQKQVKKIEKRCQQSPPKRVLDIDHLERTGLMYDPILKKENKRSKVRTRVYSPETFKKKKNNKPKIEYVKWVPQKYTLIGSKRQTMPLKFDMTYKRRFINQFKSNKIPCIEFEQLLELYKSISQWANDEHVAQLLKMHDYDIEQSESYLKRNSDALAYQIEVQRALEGDDQVQRKKI